MRAARSRSGNLAQAFAAIYLIWGSTYLAIRYGVESFPPLLMMGVRHLIAGAVLFAWARRRGAERLEPRHWGAALLLGGLFFLGGHGTLAWAEQYVASGLAALLFATEPLWIVVLDRLRPGGDRPGRTVIFGLLLGFGGVALLAGPGGFEGGRKGEGLAAMALILGAASWAAATVFSRAIRRPASLPLATAMQLLAGGALLAAASALTGEWARFSVSQVSLRSALSLGYLILFGSLIAFTTYSWLLGETSLARASTPAYVCPVIAVFLGWVLAEEALTLRILLSAGVTLAGVALVVMARSQRKLEISTAKEGGALL